MRWAQNAWVVVLLVGLSSVSLGRDGDLVIQLTMPDSDYVNNTTWYRGFAVTWSDEEAVAYVSHETSFGWEHSPTAEEFSTRRKGLRRNWEDYLLEQGINPAGAQTEVVGWFDDADESKSKREQKLSFLRDRLHYRIVEESDIEGGFRDDFHYFKTLPKAGVQTHRHIFQFEQDGLELRGTVIFNAQFHFFGYPYLKASYANLSIDAVSYRDGGGSLETYFDEDSNARTRRFIVFPYVVSSGGHHLEADFDVRLPSAFDNGDVSLEDLSRNTFMFEVKDLTPVADTYADEEVDAYFRDYQHERLHDSQIWEAARLDDHIVDPVRLRRVSPSIIREIRQRIDEYRQQVD